MPVSGPAHLRITRWPLDGSAAEVFTQAYDDASRKAWLAPIQVRKALSVGEPRTTLTFDNPFRRVSYGLGDGILVEAQGLADGDYVKLVSGFVAGMEEDVALHGALSVHVEPLTNLLDVVTLQRDFAFYGHSYRDGLLTLLSEVLPVVLNIEEPDIDYTGDITLRAGTPLRAALDAYRHALTDAMGAEWEYSYHRDTGAPTLDFYTRRASVTKTVKLADLLEPIHRDHGSIFDVANRVTVRGSGESDAGTQLYVLNDARVELDTYRLPTRYSVKGGEYVTGSALDALANMSGMFFRNDGRRLYALESSGVTEDIHEYTVSTPWDPAKASRVATYDYSLSHSSSIEGIWFRDDGFKVYLLGYGPDEIHEYDLGTAWDFGSRSLVQTLSITAKEDLPEDFFFRSDGRRLYTLGRDGAVSATRNVQEWRLLTPWDISTATSIAEKNLSAVTGAVRSLTFSPDGRTCIVAGTGSAYQLNLDTPWSVDSIDTTNVPNVTFDTSGLGTDCRGIFLRSVTETTAENRSLQATYANLVPDGVLSMTRLDDTIETCEMAYREAQALLNRRKEPRDAIEIVVPYDGSIEPGDQVALDPELQDLTGLTGPFDIVEVQHRLRGDSRTVIQANEVASTSIQSLRTVAGVGSRRSLA